MLTYSYAPISEQKMHPTEYPYAKLDSAAYTSHSSAILYDPPIEEFSVVKTELKKAGARVTFGAIDGPSIFLCTRGAGTIKVGPKEEPFKEGFVYFVGATAEVVLKGETEDFMAFHAFCDLYHKDKTHESNGTS